MHWLVWFPYENALRKTFKYAVQFVQYCIFDIQIARCISGNNVTVNNNYVSSFPSKSALSKYAIKHTTIIFEKHLI